MKNNYLIFLRLAMIFIFISKCISKAITPSYYTFSTLNKTSNQPENHAILSWVVPQMRFSYRRVALSHFTGYHSFLIDSSTIKVLAFEVPRMLKNNNFYDSEKSSDTRCLIGEVRRLIYPIYLFTNLKFFSIFET